MIQFCLQNFLIEYLRKAHNCKEIKAYQKSAGPGQCNPLLYISTSFGVRSTQTLVEIYNNPYLCFHLQ